MKNFINILTAIVIVLQLSSCGTSSDPVKIAKEFATAFLNAEYDKCNKWMEDEEFTPSKEMSSMEKAVVEAIKEEAKKMQYITTIDNEFTTIEASYADVYFDVTSATDTGFNETIRVNLRKDDNGKWYVDDYKAF
ncbi:MAG: hypothetical protein LIO93_08565 [Bacteroidales bacterium]|nr:hypothetical protein [Bacteroidales bacterium]